MAEPQPTEANPGSKAAAFGRAGLASRTVSTLALWALVIGVFIWGHPIGFAVLIGGLAVLGTVEFTGIVRHAGLLSMGKVSLVATVLYSVGLYTLLLRGQGEASHLLDGMALAAFTGVVFSFRLIGAVDGQRSALGLALAIFGFLYLAIGMNFTGRVLFFDYSGEGTPPGAWLALWLVMVTKFTDMGAFLVGTAIGKHKLIPHISPGKTREGLLGAFGVSMLAACGLYAAFPTQLALLGGWPHVIILALLVAAAAIVGDLAESLLKRSLAIKDSGHSLPGIGGVLDLIDSLIFTAPLVYFYLRCLHHPPLFF